MQAKGGFKEKLRACDERRRVNIMVRLTAFVYLIQKWSRRHYNSRVFRI